LNIPLVGAILIKLIAPTFNVNMFISRGVRGAISDKAGFIILCLLEFMTIVQELTEKNLNVYFVIRYLKYAIQLKENIVLIFVTPKHYAILKEIKVRLGKEIMFPMASYINGLNRILVDLINAKFVKQ